METDETIKGMAALTRSLVVAVMRPVVVFEARKQGALRSDESRELFRERELHRELASKPRPPTKRCHIKY